MDVIEGFRGTHTGRLATVACLVTVVVLGVPAAASAAITCDFTGGVLTVSNDSASNQPRIVMAPGGASIEVRDGGAAAATPCTGPSPISALTTSSIVMTEPPGPIRTTFFSIDTSNGPIGPGPDDEAGNSDEIEITLNGSGTDSMYLMGRSTPITGRRAASAAQCAEQI